MANERRAAAASFRSDAVPDFRLRRYYDYVDNNTLPIIVVVVDERFRSASWWREALSDDFFRRVCGDVWLAILRRSHPTNVAGQQLIVACVIIVAVTVCDLRTRILPLFPTSTTFNGNYNNYNNNNPRAIRSDRGANTRQAIIYNPSRWDAAQSLGQFLYNQQKLDHVVVVQCNQHHREMRHRGSTLILLVYKIITMANSNSHTYLLSVVDSKLTAGIARIVHSKKILTECFIFAYLISLDLYS